MSVNIYPFKTQPYKHQLEGFELSKKRKNFALFSEMGTGKSKILIDTTAFQYDDKAIDAVLIVAPKSVYSNWHDIEIPKHMPEHIKYDMALWKPFMGKSDKAILKTVFTPTDRLKIFIMNIESFSTKKGQDAAYTFLKTYKDRVSMIIDESTTIKNYKAKRTKAVLQLSKYARIRRIASGSPITRSPLDLYTQCVFLDHRLLGYNSYFAFRHRYAIMQDMDLGGRSFKKIVGYKNLEELQSRLSSFSLRLTKKECLDLPEKIYMKRDVELTAEQKRIYKQMKEECIAVLESGEIVTAQNVLTQILRLHQVVCGHINADGESREIESNRLNVLMDILEETDGKVIIWANYKADIQRISEAVRKRFGHDYAATFYGDTSSDERRRITKDFQTDGPPWYFVGNPQTGGFGLTLTAASTVIYYSNNYNLEYRLQSEDRAHRIGQKNSVTYIDLISPGTVDEKIVKALTQKKNLADTVIDNWREIIQ